MEPDSEQGGELSTYVSPSREICCVFESTLAFMAVYLVSHAHIPALIVNAAVLAASTSESLANVPRLVAPGLLVDPAEHRDELALDFASVLGVGGGVGLFLPSATSVAGSSAAGGVAGLRITPYPHVSGRCVGGALKPSEARAWGCYLRTRPDMCFDVGASLRLSAVRCLYRALRAEDDDDGDVGSATGSTTSFAEGECVRDGDGEPAVCIGGCGTLLCCRALSAEEFTLLAMFCWAFEKLPVTLMGCEGAG